ncbi:hypothetical protein Cni_G14941 [Canna indica]|uniref:Protein transport protein sec16 n=1 Tax=Canna indica TaxID=4628 RepID=A0AAQ3QCU6_9LILI|nr:hypothetical protein Cni_G14941 [Canna indica]
MASLHFSAEDQTDEDFFDNLINDDLGAPGSGSEHAAIERAFSDMSIGGSGAVLEDSKPCDSGFATREENHQENGDLAVEDSTKPLPTSLFASGVEFKTSDLKKQQDAQVSTPLSALIANGDSMETTTEVGSSAGKGSGPKGAAVKEVQWSAFRVDSEEPQLLDSDGFGSNMDFMTENAVQCNNKLEANIDQNSSSIGNSTADVCSYDGSSGQQGTLHYGSTIEQSADSQYWENLYPGWKFDINTGQWYQINNYDTITTTEAESINALKEEEHDKILSVGNGIIMEQRSEISYSQQSANTVVATVAEDSSIGHVSDWNQDLSGSTQYPPNMVLDPQYPGWYYDNNTQQWHTLQSYTPDDQATTYTKNDELSQEFPFPNGFVKENPILDNDVGQLEENTTETHYSKVARNYQDGSRSMFVQENVQQLEPMDARVTQFSENPQKAKSSNATIQVSQIMNGQVGHRSLESMSSSDNGYSNGATGFKSFIPGENIDHINQPHMEQNFQEHSSHGQYGNQNSTNQYLQPIHYANPSSSSFAYVLREGRSSAGRPPHALVTFGFGGKLVFMKDTTCSGSKLDYGNKDSTGEAIFILGLSDILTKKTDDPMTPINCNYFEALCQQSFPGPLVGGNASAKDVNKWIDDRISQCRSSMVDVTQGGLHALLLALLKISCQHYGKLRSPYGSDPSVEDIDGPGAAVTNLFASVNKNGASSVQYSSLSNCTQLMPTEGELKGTAIMVQNLLVSGKKKEALQCAQAGQLWGLALVLAAQLGEKFYVETVKQMANRQLISGSPLRTLCLLIAGQPADVFTSERSSSSTLPTMENAQGQSQVLCGGTLGDWEKHLAIITANRTKDDELVIIHLGDCVWREKGEISAAHICYLVAEANFEPYSESARMCLLGADHWKWPRTYASPDAIQRTELYEYSKVLGNSQFVLQPFQPYKLVYAYMLAEVGKVSDSLRYCQASLKLLKSSSRTPHIEILKSLFLSLEERLRMHQQGGYNTSLDPTKLVGKLFTSIDRSIHRMIGTASSPPSQMPQTSINDKQDNFVATKVNSQSTMAMSSLIPSGSAESMSDWARNSRTIMHSRSVSEPDFGKALKQEKTIDATSPDSESKASSRLGRFGSQIFQRTVGWVSRSRPDHQAKLGEQNKFYYDEKLKRWVEEGAEHQSEEPPLPPPPTTICFQNGISPNNTDSTFKSSIHSANGISGTTSPSPSQKASRIPPMSPSPNQFSARNKMGVRSRYVDTFNKSGGASTNCFQSPSTPSVNPAVGAKFFVPDVPATSDEKTTDTAGTSTLESLLSAESSTIVDREASLSSRSQSVPLALQYFPDSDNNNSAIAMQQSNSGSISSGSRATSWSGNYNTIFTPTMAEMSSSKDGLHAQSYSILNNNSSPPLDSSFTA